MMKEQSNWNGITIHGDVAEIEAIISTPCMIALDRNDIVSVLEAEGDHFVETGTGTTVEAALKAASTHVSNVIENLTDLIIAIWWGDKHLQMSAMSTISNFISTLNKSVNVVWGVFQDTTLGDTFKVVLIGTTKTK